MPQLPIQVRSPIVKHPYKRHYIYDRYGFPKDDPFYRPYFGDRPYVSNRDPYDRPEKLGKPWAAWGKKWNMDYMRRHGRKYDSMYYN